MVTTLAVVEVQPAIEHLRPDSPLAGMARRRFGGKSLLEWVVRRVSEADSISGIWVLAGDDTFSQRMLAVPPRLDRDDLRLAIRDEEDWEELQLILDALGPESLDWQFIASLLDRQPGMRARMAHRNRAAAQLC